MCSEVIEPATLPGTFSARIGPLVDSARTWSISPDRRVATTAGFGEFSVVRKRSVEHSCCESGDGPPPPPPPPPPLPDIACLHFYAC